MRTYGEAHRMVIDSMKLVKGRWNAMKLPPHKDRMSRRDASIYYTKKINKYFNEKGMKHQKKYTGIDIRPAYIVEGFDSVEDYYDYYEAKKLLHSNSK